MAQKDRRLFGAALDAMSEKVLILDRKGRIILVNQAWRDFFHRQRWRSRTFGLGEMLHSLEIMRRAGSHAVDVLSALDRVLLGAEAEFTCTFRVEANEEQWLRLHAAHIDFGKRASAVVTLDDVSDIQFAQETINYMSLRLTRLQQEERQRIAMDLHDSTAQHLAAASLNLTGLRSRVTLTGPAATLADDIERSLQTALHEVQVTSFLMYPSDLGGDGLNAALERFVRTYARQTGIVTRLRAPRLDRLALDLQRAILRVVQEALTNVHRHAQSAGAGIALRITRDSVVLCVTDTGKGMHWAGLSNQSTAGTGLGISGMSARAARLGGELRVKSQPGKGTRILVRFPLPETVQPHQTLRELVPSWSRAGPAAKLRARKSFDMTAKAS